MKRFVSIIILISAFLTVRHAVAQSKGKTIRVAFWNLENFFDPFVDSTRTYNEFTENGGQHWTKSRFYKKRNNIYKAILGMSENQPIGIMGVCEVENEYVLMMLFERSPLKRFNYRWVHYEGPDKRGIDPAIIYSKDLFQLISSEAFPYYNPEDTTYRSRDILYAKFIDCQNDTIHVFVNHWPSRYSGELETVGSRACAAAILRRKADSIIAALPDSCLPKIIMMGDLNDTPDDPSVYDVLGARHITECDSSDLYVNLFAKSKDLGFEGTLKHQRDWLIFDQIIVTPALLQSARGLRYLPNSAHIYCADFMLEDDAAYHGKKLFRTYVGPKYFGGFSDHLPVYIDLKYLDLH